MNTKTEFAVDAIFLIALALVVIGLLVNIHASGTEMVTEVASEATTEETTEYITEPTETEMPTEEATEPSVALYDVPLEETLQLHIISEANAHGIDPAIIMAMAYRESTYNPNCIGDGGDSYGLLQIQPKWHYKRMQKLGCTDLLDPYQNVIVGIDYLCEQLARYDGHMGKALTAYNAGHYSGKVTSYANTVMAMAEEMGEM